jgi:hypothetical protein
MRCSCLINGSFIIIVQEVEQAVKYYILGFGLDWLNTAL